MGSSSNNTILNIGFIILTWNSEKVIQACLKSIFSMENIDSQVVVIDNGSIDKTKDLILETKPKNGSSLKIISNKDNLGTTKTRNVGLKYIQNFNVDYYCILDSDTVVNSEAFAVMHREMELHSDYGIIGPKMIASDGTVQVSARTFPTVFEKFCKFMPINILQKIGEKMEVQAVKDGSSYTVDYLQSACWMINKKAFPEVGYLDEKIFYAPEDAEYCIRMWKSGWKVAFCPKAQIIHEWQRLSKEKFFSKMNREHIKGLIYMFIKHRYIFSVKKLRSRFPISFT